jgi:hypothetical protein
MLLLAIQQGNSALVKALLKNGADPEVRGPDGLSPLHVAVQQRKLKIVAELLDAKSDVNAKTSQGSFPLMIATERGRPDIVSILLGAKNMNLGVTDTQGNTALHIATRDGSEAIIEQLLAAGADREIKNKAGLTPGALATQQGPQLFAAYENICKKYPPTASSKGVGTPENQPEEKAEEKSEKKPAQISGTAQHLLPLGVFAASVTAHKEEIQEIADLLQYGQQFIAAIQHKLKQNPALAASKELFLLFVAANQQNLAEMMLKVHPSLANEKGVITAPSGECLAGKQVLTGLEYAQQVGNHKMGDIMRKYLSPEKKDSALHNTAPLSKK